MLLKLIVNILWFIFGGFELALGWAVTGLILCCTIVGIPLGTQCFKMACLVMLPLGTNVTYNMGVVKGCFNVLWACTFGLVFALCSACRTSVVLYRGRDSRRCSMVQGGKAVLHAVRNTRLLKYNVRFE